MNRIVQYIICIFIVQLCQSCKHIPPTRDQIIFEKIDTLRKSDRRWKPFKIHFEIDDDLEEEQRKIIESITQRAGKYFGETLQVKETGANLAFTMKSTSCTEPQVCNGVKAPISHVKNCGGAGVNADFVMYITVGTRDEVCTRNETLAYALHCSVDANDYRPLAGHANICPHSLSLRLEKLYNTFRHEVLHALAMSTSLYPYFQVVYPGKWSAKYDSVVGTELGQPWIRSIDRKWKTGAKQLLDRSVTVLSTPKLVAAVREHFNCSTLEGAELEDQGGRGTAEQHWEKRIFGPESMTGVSSSAAAPISVITLSLLEDTGWYKPNYSMAEPLFWGKGKGCDFVKKSCKEYMDIKQSKNETTAPYCIPKILPSNRPNANYPIKCNNDLTALATCSFEEHNDDLPEMFQYFDKPIDNIDVSKLHRMGGLELADFCPVPREFDWFHDPDKKDSRCADPHNEREGFLEVYSSESLCFLFNSTWLKRATCIGYKTVVNAMSGCYRHQCRDKHLFIQVKGDEKWYRCFSKGQIITISRINPSGIWLQGTIICPPCNTICDDCMENEIMSAEDYVGDDPRSNPFRCDNIPGLFNLANNHISQSLLFVLCSILSLGFTQLYF